MKKIFLVGNHSCSNRGDAAITRGILNFLNNNFRDIELKIFSRYPEGASRILSTEVRQDLTALNNKAGNGFVYRIINKIFKTDFVVILAILSYYIPIFINVLPNNMKATIKDMESADYIIQVGGSFFIDIYGLSQFRLLLCALLAKKNIFLIGHSLGPFNGFIYKLVSRWCFKHVEKIIIRDIVTAHLLDNFCPSINYQCGADCAWLVDGQCPLTYNSKIGIRKIALTFRRLGPFSSRLGLTQEQYENELANLCNSLVQNGYELEFLSTCTSYDNYVYDDRVIAASVKNQMSLSAQNKVHIVNSELTDIELGELISGCRFLIGTRLHSCIIGMNFGTPAIALAYEHKSIGLYQNMGLSDYSLMLSKNFCSEGVLKIIDMFENNFQKICIDYNHAIIAQKKLALELTQETFNFYLNMKE